MIATDDRQRLRRIAADMRAYRNDWRRRILDELKRGPATAAELWACMGYDFKTGRPTPNAYAALSALIAEGLVIERSELQPVPNVRVESVVVLELTAAGRVACEPRPEVQP
jgi:hypothetical protein